MKSSYQALPPKKKINLPRTGTNRNVFPKVSTSKSSIINKNDNQINIKSSKDMPITISQTLINTTTSSGNINLQNKNNINNINIKHQELINYPKTNINNRYNVNENTIQNEESTSISPSRKVNIRVKDYSKKKKLNNNYYYNYDTEPRTETKQTKNSLKIPTEYLKKRPQSPRTSEIKIKRLNRGENVQITHIIRTKKPSEFHINEEISNKSLYTKPLDLEKNRTKINNKNKYNAIIKCSSSCDHMKIIPIEVNLKGKTTIYQHCAGVGMTNMQPDLIKSQNYISGIREIPIKHKEKNEPIVEHLNVFRPHATSPNLPKKFNFQFSTIPNNNKKEKPKPDELYTINVQIVSRNNNPNNVLYSSRKKNLGKKNVIRYLKSYIDFPELKREMRHYFIKFKNNTKICNEQIPIKDINYVSWFYRNINNNSKENKNKLEDMIDPSNETNTILDLINERKNLYESVPYDEWFNRHSTKNKENNNDSDQIFKDKKLAIIPDNVSKMLKSLESIKNEKNDNNLYTEIEYKKIKDSVNKLPITEQKTAVILLQRNAGNYQKQE